MICYIGNLVILPAIIYTAFVMCVQSLLCLLHAAKCQHSSGCWLPKVPQRCTRRHGTPTLTARLLSRYVPGQSLLVCRVVSQDYYITHSYVSVGSVYYAVCSHDTNFIILYRQYIGMITRAVQCQLAGKYYDLVFIELQILRLIITVCSVLFDTHCQPSDRYVYTLPLGGAIHGLELQSNCQITNRTHTYQRICAAVVYERSRTSLCLSSQQSRCELIFCCKVCLQYVMLA